VTALAGWCQPAKAVTTNNIFFLKAIEFPPMRQTWWSTHRTELLAVAIWLAAAILFRSYHLLDTPPGLHYDEAIDLRQALNILDGARPLYVAEGWGREASFYYLVAAVLTVVEANPLALRLTAVLCSLVTIAVAYLWVRKMWNWPMAWLAAAWLSLTFWTVSTSRVGVRNIMLPFIFSFTVFCFWYAWQTPPSSQPSNFMARLGAGWQAFALAGLGLGLTLYTYQPARFMPFIFVGFVLYLALCHRSLLREKWRGLAVMVVAAAIIATPLLVILYQNRGAEVARDWTIEPLTELLAGNPRLVWENFLLTLKMFTFRGDPLVAYNLPQRPVFVPWWTSLFFYLGLLMAIWRWRQPLYAFLLIWLSVALAPTILTISAPHFNRTITAQIPVMVLSALPLAEVAAGGWRLTASQKPTANGQRPTANSQRPTANSQRPTANSQRLTASFWLLALVALLVTGYATWRDYFTVWPQDERLAVQYNRDLLAMAQALTLAPQSQPILLNSRNLEDADPYILAASVDEPVRGRWVDSAQAIAFPAGQDQIELWLTENRGLDVLLADWSQAQLLEQQLHFSRYQLNLPAWPPVDGVQVAYLPPTMAWFANPTSEAPTLPLPVSFAERLVLAGTQFDQGVIRAGERLAFLTFWEVMQASRPQSLAFFVHLLDAQGNIIAQQDGLGYPPHTWQAGDRFVHVHGLNLDAALPAGTYWLQLGLYQREDGQRWPIVDAAGEPVGDRLLLTPITLEPAEE
jgi:4-amino-4-deoxy-L-arabinose transferase-like glycosyltransferase